MDGCPQRLNISTPVTEKKADCNLDVNLVGLQQNPDLFPTDLENALDASGYIQLHGNISMQKIGIDAVYMQPAKNATMQ
jgi:hypothetical protein